MLVSAPTTVNIRMSHESPSRNMNPASSASSLQVSFDDIAGTFFLIFESGWFLFCWLILSLITT